VFPVPGIGITDREDPLAVRQAPDRRRNFAGIPAGNSPGDGEADPTLTFGGLATLMRSARIDMGIEIEILLDDLHLGDAGTSHQHAALGIIRYPKRGGKREKGYLLYIKSSFTGNEDETIQEYRAKNPDFPHETTADQFFDEDQFEAYRALGNHAAKDLFKKDLFTEQQWDDFKNRKFKCRVWLEALVNALEPPLWREPKT